MSQLTGRWASSWGKCKQRFYWYPSCAINTLAACGRNRGKLSFCNKFSLIASDFHAIELRLSRKSSASNTVEKVKQFLQPTYTMSMNDQELDEETMKQITLNNLCNSGLLDREIRWSSNGKHQHISYKITHLGKLILKKIGE